MREQRTTMMGISQELADYLIKNAQEVSFMRRGSKEKILQVSLSRADVLDSEKMSGVLTEMHTWFTMSASGFASVSLETDKYSNIFPYQFYGSVSFEGVDPTTQFYVFQFTYTPKLFTQPIKVERKTLWKKMRNLLTWINQRT